MGIDKTNIHKVNFSKYLHLKIKLVGTSNRRKSNIDFNGRENCSGYNINKYIFNGMSVIEYQRMIRQNFHVKDPQFSLTKHLKYDIEKGFIELY